MKADIDIIVTNEFLLTLSWRRLLSYRNQSIDLQTKSMDWFLYDNSFRHERVNLFKIVTLLINKTQKCLLYFDFRENQTVQAGEVWSLL